MWLLTRSEGKRSTGIAKAAEEEGKRKHHLSRQVPRVQDAALDPWTPWNSLSDLAGPRFHRPKNLASFFHLVLQSTFDETQFLSGYLASPVTCTS